MNLWSGGDYLGNTSGTYNSQSLDISISSDWSSNEDMSFLCQSQGEILGDIFRLPVESYENGDYILKLKIYNPTSDMAVIFFNSGTNNARVSVPKSDEPTPVQLSLTANNEGYLSCRVSSSGPALFYFDEVAILSSP